MNLAENNSKNINRPALHTTFKVLHNLWSDGNLDTLQVDNILRKDYGYILQHMEKDFMHVESLDGLSTYSFGDVDKYRKV